MHFDPFDSCTHQLELRYGQFSVTACELNDGNFSKGTIHSCFLLPIIEAVIGHCGRRQTRLRSCLVAARNVVSAYC